MDQIIGSHLFAASAWSCVEDVFNNSVSGGGCTQLVLDLLSLKQYDSAFLVGEATLDQTCSAKRYEDKDDIRSTQKSKYLQVSHEATLRHMLLNRQERIIIVGTPCAVRGLLKAIKLFHLNRGNYLFIGLFCDKTMTSNVLNYFKDLAEGFDLKSADFRSKEAGGWPGNIRLNFVDGSHRDFDRSFRMSVKDYFQPECCLYCLDKLNILADLSLGDDYTSSCPNPKGANSVIVRTKRGLAAWGATLSHLEVVESSIEQIAESQHVISRTKNFGFRILKENTDSYHLNKSLDISKSDIKDAACSPSNQKAYEKHLRKIAIGAAYERDRELLLRELKRNNSFIRKIVRKVLRVGRKILRSGS